jgi:RNA polymerase sigma factor (sigma-70 family)
VKTVQREMASLAPELPVLARDQAFELLYRRYVKDVYHYALALLRNPADAEDVTQTTFLNAYRAWKRGEEIEKPQNWLIKIAHNVARTRYARAARRVKEVPLEDHVEQLAAPEEERPNVEGVLRALGRLPFNQRAALVMRELEGRPYAEIADTIGVSVPAVETLIFRARRSLRLRASALRSLAAVPVPGSLAQLFGGGGVAAGGGAAVGTGFLVKAAVAVLVGAVATGVGGGNTGPATVGPKSTAHLGAAAASAGLVGIFARTQSGAGVRASAAKHRRGAHATVSRGSLPGASLVAGEHPQLTSAPASGTTATPTADQTTLTVDTQLVTTVTSLTNQVEETVAATASTLPVEIPSVPPLPVAPPPPPKLP